MFVLVYKQGTDMNWVLLDRDAEIVFTLIRCKSGTFLMEYEGMGQAIPDSYGLYLLRLWKMHYDFDVVPEFFFKIR